MILEPVMSSSPGSGLQGPESKAYPVKVADEGLYSLSSQELTPPATVLWLLMPMVPGPLLRFFHSQISTIEKQATTATGCHLLIRCKNFQLLQLIIPQERDCHDVYISLIRLTRPVKYEELYCFSFNPKLDKEEREQGWMLLDLSEEYKRMGLPDDHWQLSDVNRDYRVCDSYPTELYVPKSATAHIIVGSSKFRSRRRFPALSYYSKDNHASICRSSQPLSGFSARCLEDEQMLQAIRKANPGSDFIYVVDTRPKVSVAVPPFGARLCSSESGPGPRQSDGLSSPLRRLRCEGLLPLHSQHPVLCSALLCSAGRCPGS
ncbi:hypothetical protein QTO34_016548 [Cnephaeus nilssonii]|uniref:Myotubularin phosphatase domain-containing protein n=1 Tax=Cnephaeus nilssonii TaxID=3371016 RepID=A0AA40I2F7_CNENI|nr:hypothetical protein QTO34_016548 [Eptesicus nilssonii]